MGLITPLESTAWDDVEHPAGALAVLGGVAAALHLDVVDVARVELRADTAGDVGIGDRDTVDQPVDLMSSSNVKLVVHDVRARDEVGDHRQAVGAIGTRRALDIDAADRVLRGRRSWIDRLG